MYTGICGEYSIKLRSQTSPNNADYQQSKVSIRITSLLKRTLLCLSLPSLAFPSFFRAEGFERKIAPTLTDPHRLVHQSFPLRRLHPPLRLPEAAAPSR